MSKKSENAAAAMLTLAGAESSARDGGLESFGEGSAVAVLTSSVQKDAYVLGTHPFTSRLAAAAWKAKAVTAAAIAAYDASIEPLRAYGEAARMACVGIHGGDPLASVKVPYVDNDGADRVATVTVAQKFSIDKGILDQAEVLGGQGELEKFVVASDSYVVTDKGLDILRGLLARAGLKGKQIDGAIEQICEKKTSISTTSDYEQARKAATPEQAPVLDKYIVRAKAAVKL